MKSKPHGIEISRTETTTWLRFGISKIFKETVKGDRDLKNLENINKVPRALKPIKNSRKSV